MSGKHARAQAEGPLCPFCGAAWSTAMLDQFDRFTAHADCSCCGGQSAPATRPQEPAAEDICCASCGRAIYRAMPVRTR